MSTKGFDGSKLNGPMLAATQLCLRNIFSESCLDIPEAMYESNIYVDNLNVNMLQ